MANNLNQSKFDEINKILETITSTNNEMLSAMGPYPKVRSRFSIAESLQNASDTLKKESESVNDKELINTIKNINYLCDKICEYNKTVAMLSDKSREGFYSFLKPLSDVLGIAKKEIIALSKTNESESKLVETVNNKKATPVNVVKIKSRPPVENNITISENPLVEGVDYTEGETTSFTIKKDTTSINGPIEDLVIPFDEVFDVKDTTTENVTISTVVNNKNGEISTKVDESVDNKDANTDASVVSSESTDKTDKTVAYVEEVDGKFILNIKGTTIPINTKATSTGTSTVSGEASEKKDANADASSDASTTVVVNEIADTSDVNGGSSEKKDTTTDNSSEKIKPLGYTSQLPHTLYPYIRQQTTINIDDIEAMFTSIVNDENLINFSPKDSTRILELHTLFEELYISAKKERQKVTNAKSAHTRASKKIAKNPNDKDALAKQEQATKDISIFKQSFGDVADKLLSCVSHLSQEMDNFEKTYNLANPDNPLVVTDIAKALVPKAKSNLALKPAEVSPYISGLSETYSIIERNVTDVVSVEDSSKDNTAVVKHDSTDIIVEEGKDNTDVVSVKEGKNGTDSSTNIVAVEEDKDKTDIIPVSSNSSSIKKVTETPDGTKVTDELKAETNTYLVPVEERDNSDNTDSTDENKLKSESTNAVPPEIVKTDEEEDIDKTSNTGNVTPPPPPNNDDNNKDNNQSNSGGQEKKEDSKKDAPDKQAPVIAAALTTTLSIFSFAALIAGAAAIPFLGIFLWAFAITNAVLSLTASSYGVIKYSDKKSAKKTRKEKRAEKLAEKEAIKKSKENAKKEFDAKKKKVKEYNKQKHNENNKRRQKVEKAVKRHKKSKKESTRVADTRKADTIVVEDYTSATKGKGGTGSTVKVEDAYSSSSATEMKFHPQKPIIAPTNLLGPGTKSDDKDKGRNA